MKIDESIFLYFLFLFFGLVVQSIFFYLRVWCVCVCYVTKIHKNENLFFYFCIILAPDRKKTEFYFEIKSWKVKVGRVSWWNRILYYLRSRYGQVRAWSARCVCVCCFDFNFMFVYFGRTYVVYSCCWVYWINIQSHEWNIPMV